MDNIAGSDGPLLRAEDGQVSGSVRVPMEVDVKIVDLVLDHIRLVEGDGGQFWRVVLELSPIAFKLSNLFGAKRLFRR